MEDGTILGASVSSSQSFGDFSAGNARLNHARGWYTGAKTTSKDWVQINLNSSHAITALATQVDLIIYGQFVLQINQKS